MSRPLPHSLSLLALPLLVAFGAGAWLPGAARAQPPPIHTYASQVTDVDAVNSHWIEGEDGVVLIDAQRLLPEAARALRHLRRSTRSARFPDGKPVVGIVVTHAHTDHYGGLSVFAEAFPDAPIFAAEETIRAMREDTRGFNAMRRERHGARFPTQETISAHLPGRVARDGQTVTLASVEMRFVEMGASEAPPTTMVYLPSSRVLFTGNLVNEGVPAVPFESLSAWLDQLDGIEQRFPNLRALYQGHGAAPLDPRRGLYEQRRFLMDLREQVAAALESGGRVTDAETEAIVLELERRYPFYTGVAGNTRREMLAFDVERVAAQLESGEER